MERALAGRHGDAAHEDLVRGSHRGVRAAAERHGDTAHEDLVRGSHCGVLAHHGQWQFDFGVCIQLAILVISNGSSGVAPATDQLRVSACANTNTNDREHDVRTC